MVVHEGGRTEGGRRGRQQPVQDEAIHDINVFRKACMHVHKEQGPLGACEVWLFVKEAALWEDTDTMSERLRSARVTCCIGKVSAVLYTASRNLSSSLLVSQLILSYGVPGHL